MRVASQVARADIARWQAHIGLTLGRNAGFGCDLLLDLASEAVGMRNADLDPSLGSAGVVEVRIPIRPETCVECLLPEDLVATILKREFEAVMPEVVRVDIRLFKDETKV